MNAEGGGGITDDGVPEQFVQEVAEMVERMRANHYKDNPKKMISGTFASPLLLSFSLISICRGRHI